MAIQQSDRQTERAGVGTVQVSHDYLVEKLGLPKGTEIVGVIDHLLTRDTIQLYVEHESLPPVSVGVEPQEVEHYSNGRYTSKYRV